MRCLRLMKKKRTNTKDTQNQVQPLQKTLEDKERPVNKWIGLLILRANCRVANIIKLCD